MNKDINQKFSRFLDDELTLQELDQVLLDIKQQPVLKETLQRYQLINHVLKNETMDVNADFLAKVKQAVDKEPHHFLPKKMSQTKASRVWQKVPLAIAASVAMVSVLVSQMDRQPNAITPQAQVVAQVQVDDLKSKERVKSKLQHERLKAYLKAHNDDLYADETVTFRPYARVASYGQE